MIRRILPIAFCLFLFNCTIMNAATLSVPAQYPTIQQALTAGQPGDTIEVSNGYYTGPNNTNLDFGGKDLTLRSTGGAATCIIDCQQAARAILFNDDETPAAVVDGFTFKNGRTTGTQPINRGGAILIQNSHPTIRNCIFRENSSENGGGALALLAGGGAQVVDCEFLYNGAHGGGGAINNTSGILKMFDCRLFGNSTETGGGAIWSEGGPGDYFGVVIEGNQSMIAAGGIGVTNIAPVNFYNCVIAYNVANAWGGGVVTWDTSRTNFYNCTIIYNNAPGEANGVFAFGTYMPFLRNCIVYYNGGLDVGADQAQVPASFCNIYYSGVYPGTGNMNVNPLFAVQDQYYLSSTEAGQSENSPCLNTGGELAEELCASSFMGYYCMNQFSTRTDLEPDEGVVDMGYHYWATIPSATATPAVTPTPTAPPTLTPTPTPTFRLCEPEYNYYPLFEEHFSTWPLDGWTIEINDGDCEWESNFTCGLPNYAGFDGGAACCANEWCGAQGRYNTVLISPPLDFSSEPDVLVQFMVSMRHNEAGDFLRVDSIVDSDVELVLLLDEEHSPFGPGELIQQNVSYLGMQSNVRFQITCRSYNWESHVMIDRFAVMGCREGNPPTPTAVPPTPTLPSAPTWTPSPVPTSTCSELGCQVVMPSALFAAGDVCYCLVQICNPGSESLGTLPVFVILDVYGSYFFAPGFSNYDYYAYDITSGQQTIEVLPPFEWPADTGSASGIRWYAGITDAGITTLVGNYGLFTFGWH